MAKRTIRARRASPYLLYLVIALSVLFVAAMVMFFWMYSQKSQVDLNTFGQERLEAVGADTQGMWRDLLDKNKDDGDTVVDIVGRKQETIDAYRSEIQRLTQAVNGDPLNTQQGQRLRQSVADVLKGANEAMVQAGQALQASYQVGGEAADVRMTSMQATVRSLVQRIAGLVDQIKATTAAVGQLELKLKGIQEELAAAKTEQARQIAQLNQSLNDEKARLTKARDDAVQQTNQANDEVKRVTDRLMAERGQWARERDRLNRDILTLQNNLKDLTVEVAEFRKVPTETGVDGHVVSVAQQGLVAYGDMGKKDGVLLGMTFSIFSPTELGKTKPEPKAQCRIVKIMDNSCELRIHEIQKDNPVVSGDVLHNPVYDRSRRLRFVLVGKMDIDGDGFDDSEQLKALIQEFGGRVDPALSVQTDYLVVGEDPERESSKPGVPAADASPMERQKYEEYRKRLIEYAEARARAENFSIPVLSLNRFLGLVGLAGQS